MVSGPQVRGHQAHKVREMVTEMVTEIAADKGQVRVPAQEVEPDWEVEIVMPETAEQLRGAIPAIPQVIHLKGV